jgi:hypothetical protein
MVVVTSSAASAAISRYPGLLVQVIGKAVIAVK